jgi:hypothetical protein
MSADFRSPTRWLYPLKPGGERKSANVRQKMVTLIYPDPLFSSVSFILLKKKKIKVPNGASIRLSNLTSKDIKF